MAIKDDDFKELQDKVREIDGTLRGLRTAAAVLGVTGVALLAFLGFTFRTASKASDTADLAQKAADSAKSAVADATAQGLTQLGEKANDLHNSLATAAASAVSDEVRNRHLELAFLSSSALTPEVTWRQGEGAKSLGVGEADGFCFLTMVTGNFAGSAEIVRIESAGGQFVLTGGSAQCCVAATARCIRYPNRPEWR